MVETLIKAITDWPVLVQGAVGSALFWLVLLVGQKGVSAATTKYSSKSKAKRRAYLIEQRLKYGYKLAKENDFRAAIFAGLLYRASRNALRACIWLTLGLAVSAVVPVFGVVGFMGALYYFLEALNTVTAVPETEDVAAKIKAITEELKSLGEA
ncbi:hypothetical protein [Roseateles cavernae]|uniref:hypothetical protein n=1 Tax=Roseateles cavernae TaxID=3153578 RepID=UPI0032E46913